MSDGFWIMLFCWWLLAGLSIICGMQVWEGFFRPSDMLGRYEAFIMAWIFVPLVLTLGAVTYGLWVAV